ncbi:protein phosphatase 2C domain-containing protein [Acaryochloris marina]|uniref:protein phosphatase 2C domain-containing protein n=1 Tax=Acaryochloris marina TaxID=155978 RepID=UPI0021C48C43|nr:protein phosphatase 2C domain-containing protein [Acaryochloris marina]BDM83789.1 hypothetical protein AM10699_66500 [Acaryochloris marina MBIC10699]
MNNLVYIFSIPKEGETQENNQDAAFCNDNGTLLAIADGVSSSLFSKEWAQIITKEFCKNSYVSLKDLCENWYCWLHPLQENWRSFYLSKVSSLPWYAKGSIHKDHGSATFLGLKIYKCISGKGYWEAISIGDSCLFQIYPQAKRINSYPQMKSNEFNSISRCASSLPEYNSCLPYFWSGEYNQDDYFVLATDAIAQWIVKSLETQSFNEDILRIKSNEKFSKYIFDLRFRKEIHNDDTSIVITFPKIHSGNINSLESNSNKRNKIHILNR